MGHEPRPYSVGIGGLGSHDLGVATRASELYGAGHFPTLVFSGGKEQPAAEDDVARLANDAREVNDG